MLIWWLYRNFCVLSILLIIQVFSRTGKWLHRFFGILLIILRLLFWLFIVILVFEQYKLVVCCHSCTWFSCVWAFLFVLSRGAGYLKWILIVVWNSNLIKKVLYLIELCWGRFNHTEELISWHEHILILLDLKHIKCQSCISGVMIICLRSHVMKIICLVAIMLRWHVLNFKSFAKVLKGRNWVFYFLIFYN
jgi:hypothetical protein